MITSNHSFGSRQHFRLSNTLIISRWGLSLCFRAEIRELCDVSFSLFKKNKKTKRGFCETMICVCFAQAKKACWQNYEPTKDRMEGSLRTWLTPKLPASPRLVHRKRGPPGESGSFSFSSVFLFVFRPSLCFPSLFAFSLSPLPSYPSPPSHLYHSISHFYLPFSRQRGGGAKQRRGRH